MFMEANARLVCPETGKTCTADGRVMRAKVAEIRTEAHMLTGLGRPELNNVL